MAASGGRLPAAVPPSTSRLIHRCSISWAGVFWVLLSELFSMSAKSPAAAAATAVLFLTGAPLFAPPLCAPLLLPALGSATAALRMPCSTLACPQSPTHASRLAPSHPPSPPAVQAPSPTPSSSACSAGWGPLPSCSLQLWQRWQASGCTPLCRRPRARRCKRSRPCSPSAWRPAAGGSSESSSSSRSMSSRQKSSRSGTGRACFRRERHAATRGALCISRWIALPGPESL